MSSLALALMIALAARPGFEDGAPVLRAGVCEGALETCVAPTAAAWKRAAAYEIPLRMTPPTLRYEEPAEQSIDTLEVRVLAAADGVAIRIAWRDATANLPASRTGDLGSFPDAVAVQFPAGASERVLPAMAMGSEDRAVNIWRWAAGGEGVEETVAEGFGWLHAIEEETPVRATGVRVDGGWAVTLWRPYEVEPVVSFLRRDEQTVGQAERVRIEHGARLPCAFAVWNGAYDERDGRKGVSIWYYLQLPAH